MAAWMRASLREYPSGILTQWTTPSAVVKHCRGCMTATGTGGGKGGGDDGEGGGGDGEGGGGEGGGGSGEGGGGDGEGGGGEGGGADGGAGGLAGGGIGGNICLNSQVFPAFLQLASTRACSSFAFSSPP